MEKVVHNGRTISEPSDCLEKEIRRRTVYISSPKGPHCTGVILDSSTILTAGHCHPKPNKIRQIGDNDNLIVHYFDEKQGKLTRVNAVASNSSQFDGSGSVGKVWFKDSMAIKLSSPIPGEFQTLKKAERKSLKSTDRVAVAGYGLTETGKPSTKLKYFEGSVEEVRWNDGTGMGSELAIFSRNKGDRADEGDSGGPAFVVKPNCQLELAGINVGSSLVADVDAAVIRSVEEFDEHIEGANERYRFRFAPSFSSDGKNAKGAK